MIIKSINAWLHKECAKELEKKSLLVMTVKALMHEASQSHLAQIDALNKEILLTQEGYEQQIRQLNEQIESMRTKKHAKRNR